jgi:hypothetical protein
LIRAGHDFCIEDYAAVDLGAAADYFGGTMLGLMMISRDGNRGQSVRGRSGSHIGSILATVCLSPALDRLSQAFEHRLVRVLFRLHFAQAVSAERCRSIFFFDCHGSLQ